MVRAYAFYVALNTDDLQLSLYHGDYLQCYVQYLCLTCYNVCLLKSRGSVRRSEKSLRIAEESYLRISEEKELARGLPAGIPSEASGTVVVGENVTLEGRTYAGESSRDREREYHDAPQQQQRGPHFSSSSAAFFFVLYLVPVCPGSHARSRTRPENVVPRIARSVHRETIRQDVHLSSGSSTAHLDTCSIVVSPRTNFVFYARIELQIPTQSPTPLPVSYSVENSHRERFVLVTDFFELALNKNTPVQPRRSNDKHAFFNYVLRSKYEN